MIAKQDLSDLGSIRVTLDSARNVAGYSDGFYPALPRHVVARRGNAFGETMPERSMVSSADPRYQFASKELDTKTGLYYFGVRYYNPRIEYGRAGTHAGTGVKV